MKQALDWTGSQNRVENYFGDVADAPREFSETWGLRAESLARISKSKPIPASGTWLEELGQLRRAIFSVLSHLGFVPSSAGFSTTFGVLSATLSEISKDDWDMKNQRRLYLIDKKYQSGLSEAETDELECLQNEISIYLEAIAPLPFETLEQLEAIASQLEQEDQPPK